MSPSRASAVLPGLRRRCIALMRTPACVPLPYYSDASGALRGYVRYANGSFTEFMATGNATFTVPASINWLGTVVGSYFSPSFPFPTFAETFVRFASGAVVLFNAPEAGQLGTEPFAINSFDEFTGLWFDANFVGHGFVAAAVPW